MGKSCPPLGAGGGEKSQRRDKGAKNSFNYGKELSPFRGRGRGEIVVHPRHFIP